MSTFQHSELLPEHEILQNKTPAVMEEANRGSDPEKKQAEHGTELYQISDWKYCCKLLILRSARVLARDNGSNRVCFVPLLCKHANCMFGFKPDGPISGGSHPMTKASIPREIPRNRQPSVALSNSGYGGLLG